MKKELVYLLSIVTGVILTFAVASCANLSDNYEIVGLEMFEEPKDCTEYSQFEVFQVVESGCALAFAKNFLGISDKIVFIIPNENQHFYDGQDIFLEESQCAQWVGIFWYNAKNGIQVIKIVECK